jgi:glycosyltransferase involved in cell wall biosynthesis
MVVTIANALAAKGLSSSVVTTRAEGVLVNQLATEVTYFYLHKKRTFDLLALKKCLNFIKKNNVKQVHAHSSSWFFGVLIKIGQPNIKLVWHDHHGNRINSAKTNWKLKIASLFFSSVITVNQELENWAKKNLWCKNVYYLQNFIAYVPTEKLNKTVLKGIEGKRMVCLANLRNPKNHTFLIEMFVRSNAIQEGWTLHLIGNMNDKEYLMRIQSKIDYLSVLDSIFIYGAKNDIDSILHQCEIGVLLSTSEGFPVTLLEYGKAGLAVISSDVGCCNVLIKDNITGFLVSVNDEKQTLNAFDLLIKDIALRKRLGKNLCNFVSSEYNSEKAIVQLMKIYTQ